jgi:UDP-N-acetylmuramyl pentapeptide phosphotransferase/UDP-N-acetylglucosamine-1-phosphate transferase
MISPPRSSLPAMDEALLRAAVVAFPTALLACVATRALIPLLRRRQVFDHPTARSSHTVPTPRGGGVAVIGSVLLAWVVLARAGLVAPGVIGISVAAALLAIISWIDDLRGLSPILRLVAQAVAVAIGIFVLSEPRDQLDGWLEPSAYFAMGILWVWWINLFNFMDGIDGIAGSETAAIGAGLLLFATLGAGSDPALALLAATIIGAAIGFLVWNWSPARIFLGDVGSAPLGYLLGFLLLGLALRGHWKIALILPLYFLADATITLARRLLRGERVWEAHREHFYQLAVRRGFGHAAVVQRVIAADIVLIGCGWAAENGWAGVSLAASVATVAFLLAVLAHGR